MKENNLLKVIEILSEKITNLETSLFIAEHKNEELTAENARLNELLTPKAKGEQVNE